MTLTACAEPDCTMPAEVVETFTLESTDGPVSHIVTCCLVKHHLTVRLES